MERDGCGKGKKGVMELGVRRSRRKVSIEVSLTEQVRGYQLRIKIMT